MGTRSLVVILVAGCSLAVSAQRQPAAVLSQLTWYARSGTAIGKWGPIADHGNIELSPDGRQVAVAVIDKATRTRDLWIYGEGGARRQFTVDAAEENWMIWSPTGLRVVLNSLVPGRSRLLESPVSAPSPGQTFETDGGGVWPVSWSPDGRTILYVTNSRETSNDVWALPAGGGEPRPFLRTPASENWAAFSPDGQWVAYSSTAASDVPEVFVTRFPAGGRSWRISTDGGSQARWRGDGKEIFYLAPDRTLIAATVALGADGVTVSRTESLFRMTFPYGAYHAFDVSKDGTRVLVNTVVGGNTPAEQARLTERPSRPRS